MSIKWKSPERFKPAPVLERIDSVRTVSDEGRVSYAGGIELVECLPTLQSMLKFPPAAAEFDKQALVWKALSGAGRELTPKTFLSAINCALSEKLSVRETSYFVLTSISLDLAGIPKKATVLDCCIEFLPNGYQRKFKSRQNLIDRHRLSILDTPESYTKVVVKVRAKSDRSAFHKAMRAIDLHRAILCMMANPTMQFSLGRLPSLDPINAIRLGGRHTVHLEDGTSAGDTIWYEPGFIPVSPHCFQKPEVVIQKFKWALRKIKKSQFKDAIESAILQFVRALDHSDHNTAFLRLWSALESLTTPDVGQYDKLIRRTAFLFQDYEYHRQVLEHLREYRNASVHAGEESENAKIHCFQLQMYFVNVAWFFIRNATNFSSIDDAGDFLDLPPDRLKLQRRLDLIKMAIKFTSPSDV